MSSDSSDPPSPEDSHRNDPNYRGRGPLPGPSDRTLRSHTLRALPRAVPLSARAYGLLPFSPVHSDSSSDDDVRFARINELAQHGNQVRERILNPSSSNSSANESAESHSVDSLLENLQEVHHLVLGSSSENLSDQYLSSQSSLSSDDMNGAGGGGGVEADGNDP